MRIASISMASSPCRTQDRPTNQGALQARRAAVLTGPGTGRNVCPSLLIACEIENMTQSRSVSTGSPYEPIVAISRAARIGSLISVAGTAPLGPDGEDGWHRRSTGGGTGTRAQPQQRHK